MLRPPLVTSAVVRPMQKQRQSSMLQFLGGRKGQGKGKGKGKGRGARPQDSAAPAPADPPASPAAAAPPPPTDDGSPIRKRLKSDSNPHSPEFRSPGGTTPPDPGATATAPGPSGPAQAPGPPPDGAAANADLPRQLSSDYVDAWDSHHVKLPCSPSYVYWTNGKMRSVWYLISDVLSTKIEDAEELQEAIEAMNPLVDQSDWDFTGLRCYFQVPAAACPPPPSHRPKPPLRGRTGRGARAVRDVGYSGPVSPDGQGDRSDLPPPPPMPQNTGSSPGPGGPAVESSLFATQGCLSN